MARSAARCVVASIAVMRVPDVTSNMLSQDHDVASSNRRRSRRRGGTGKMAA